MNALRKLLVALLWMGALAGCGTLPERPVAPQALLMDGEFSAPAEPTDAAQVFAMSPAMRRYLEVDIAPMLRTLGPHRGLVEALHRKAQLRLDYDNERTRNAAEAFDARSGNCLSLVVMTAAFAKALDLPIQYQALVGQEVWSRDGNLSLINGHVNITVAKRMVDRLPGYDPDAPIRLDFGSLTVGRGAALRTVSEATIVSMFMNNRAAEALVVGDRNQAYAYAREAVKQDPGYAGAFNTLAVIYRQHGLTEAAERTLRHALALDGEHRAALDNLARLLESQGRAAEAQPLRLVLSRLEREPPFQQFDLAREALARGAYAEAREHLLREMRRDPDYHEFHFWLAIALAGLGDSKGAADQLAAAMANSTTKRDHAIYAGKLERLKAVTRVN